MFANEFIIKIASRCNLNCDYCYEYNAGDLSWKKEPHFMSEETAQQVAQRIDEHCRFHSVKEAIITFHGGEPLLAGHKRLRNLYKLFKGGIASASVRFGMQTNAVLIDDVFISIFRDFNATISVSIDGPREVHDKHRITHSGSPSFDLVSRGLGFALTSAPQVVSGLLSVIDVNTDPQVQLEFFRSLGVPRIDFLLPLNHWGRPPTRPRDDPAAYGRWLFRLYDHWSANPDFHFLRIRILEHMISRLVGGISLYEVGTLDPVRLLVISPSGKYECVDSIKSTASGLQQTGLSVFDSQIDKALESPLIKQRFSAEKQLCDECTNCAEMPVCGGGYFPHRFNKAGAPHEFRHPSVYCADLKWVFAALRKRISDEVNGKQFLSR